MMCVPWLGAIIGSAVDGIPFYVRDGVTGLLFEKENVDELADRLRQLLGDPPRARSLGEQGHQLVHELYSEDQFVEQYRQLIERVLAERAETRR